jgi:hypothetical protein
MNIDFCILLIRLLPFVVHGNWFELTDIPGSINKTTDKASIIYNDLDADELSYDAFILAYEGFNRIFSKQMIDNDSLLTIIDYSLPSDQKRLWIIDIKNQKVLENTLVAHGKASGTLIAESFSDLPQSHQSCLGFFVTGKTYVGKHGYSLILNGIEEGINKNARKRSIVFHGASYVSTTFIEKNGRLGRSFGCPALPLDQNARIIDLIKDNTCVFIYSTDQAYLTHSKLINPSYYSQKAR